MFLHTSLLSVLLGPVTSTVLAVRGEREGGGLLKYHLTDKDIAAIESGLNKGGMTEVVLKVVNGKLEVILHEKKKIA